MSFKLELFSMKINYCKHEDEEVLGCKKGKGKKEREKLIIQLFTIEEYLQYN